MAGLRNLKRYLFEQINSLNTVEHEEILKIIRKRNVNVSRNKNGFFFNLSTIDDVIIKEISDFVEYCTLNKVDLDEYDKRLSECKVNNKRFDNVLNLNLETMIEYPDTHTKRSGYHNWDDVEMDEKQAQKLISFIDHVVNDNEHVNKKKISVKYMNARKKFSKRSFFEHAQKYEAGGLELTHEKYLQ